MPTKPGHITTERARQLAAMRKVRAGNRSASRPPVPSTCPRCGAGLLSTTERRAHKCGLPPRGLPR